MARISTYVLDAAITALDLLVGTDAEDANITKNYQVGSLQSFILAPGLIEHADNAAAIAAGLVTGEIYRTGDALKIVHV